MGAAKALAAVDLDPIVQALTTDVTAATAQTTLVGLRTSGVALDNEIAAAEAMALDPLVPASVAEDARSQMERLSFSRRRVTAQEEALKRRVAELQTSEERASREAELEAAITERDAIAAQMRERYPVLAQELASLFAAILANESRLADAGRPCESAEAMARGCPGNFMSSAGPVDRLTSTRLLALDPREQAVWRSRAPARLG